MTNKSFEDLVSIIPVEWETILSKGISWFISNQDPEGVDFERGKNGWRITVITDNENSQEAKEFWNNYVHPKLEGEE